VTPSTFGLRPLLLHSSFSPLAIAASHSHVPPLPSFSINPPTRIHASHRQHQQYPQHSHQATSSPIGELRLDRSQSENVDDIRVGMRPRECDWDCCESCFEPRLLGADVGEAARSYELVCVGMGTGTATVADVNIEIKAFLTRQSQPRLASLDRI
jgi:hypothetical protein